MGRSNARGAVLEGEKVKTPTRRDHVAPAEKTGDWWDGFALAVADPRTSTYDYLKNSLMRCLDPAGSGEEADFLSRAQKKAVREFLELTDPKELRALLQRLEGNRLLFDFRTRAGVQSVRLLMDVFLAAREQYEGQASQRTPRRDIERLVAQKLADPRLAENIEALAATASGRTKGEVGGTLREAGRQLRRRPDLARMTRDIVRASKSALTLDNMVNIGVCALPLVTWQYRWALAAAMGVYVSRKAAYHGFMYAGAKWRGDRETARGHGQMALAALKAAGGNALAIGVSPLMGRLPKLLAGAGTFCVSLFYNTGIDLTQRFMEQTRRLIDIHWREWFEDARTWGKGLFTRYRDGAVIVTTGTVHNAVNSGISGQFALAAKRISVADAVYAAGRLWTVGRALSERFNHFAHEMRDGHVAVYSPMRRDFGRAGASERLSASGVHIPGADSLPDFKTPVYTRYEI